MLSLLSLALSFLGRIFPPRLAEGFTSFITIPILLHPLNIFFWLF